MKERIIIPKAYPKNMTIRETEISIKFIKDYFERALAAALNLTRVSAPLFVKPETGLNDNLNGVERPVSFGILEQDDAVCEIVHLREMEARCAFKLRICRGRRAVYRHERNPPR